MFTAFALFILAFKVFPSRVSLPTAREVPLNATAPQTARRRPPSRRRLICTWVPDAQTGRLSCVWTHEPSLGGGARRSPSAPGAPWDPGDDAPRRRLVAA